MVRNILYFLFCLFISMILEAKPIVETSIESASTAARFPIQGTVLITHDKNERVDLNSFFLEGKPLEVSLVKNVNMSIEGDTVVTIYSFQLPGKEKGGYLLAPITVKIGGKSYNSLPFPYEVQGEGAAGGEIFDSRGASKTAKPAFFRLEAFVEGEKILYPGERTKLSYKIMYDQSVDLTRSVLPMVHPANLIKVGDVQIKDYQLPEATVQKLTQEVQASEMGTFSFGPSLIEGYAYTMEGGEKIYRPSLLKAEAPIVTVEVKPFPTAAQPASFTNALGKIQIQTELTSPHTLRVGDHLQLLVKISGVSNLADFRLPSLECQPGVSGFFETSRAPSLADVKEDEKTFLVELRPLNALIKAIPPLEVSSFDLDSRDYVMQMSAPIPIFITDIPLRETKAAAIPFKLPSSSMEEWPSPTLSSLTIKGSLLFDHAEEAGERSRWGLFALLLAFILLVLQVFLKREWEKR